MSPKVCDNEVSKIHVSNMKAFAQIQYENTILRYSRINNTSLYNMSDIDFQFQLFTFVHDVASLNFLSLTYYNFMQKKACRLN